MARMGATAGRRAGGYKFTAKRAESLARARAVSAANRRARSQRTNAIKKTVVNRKGSIKPFARATRHSQTIGIEGRTPVIPGTNRRFATSAYIRLENINRTTLVDKAIPRTTIRNGKIKSSLGQHVREAKIPMGRRGGRSSAV